jgi:multiple sugar transport system ATP-binding protein
MSRLELSGIAKSFGATRVLDDVSLSVDDGTFVVLVGPSGCGKTTLLRIIAGLERPDAGDVSIAGRRVNRLNPAQRRIAMVFQSYALYPHMDAFQNMAFGLRYQKLPRREIAERVNQVAHMLGIGDLLARKPRELSGGQRQRVAIGRAIVRNPDVFLFDEPLSNLDAALRASTRLELAALHRALGTTMVFVTHDQAEAMTLAELMVVMNGGRIEQAGAPAEVYKSPANMFVAGFLGHPRMNFVTGKVADAFNAATLGIRPEHLKLSGGGQEGYPAKVLHLEHLGAEAHVHVEAKGLGRVTVRTPGDASWKPGDTPRVSYQSEFTHRFDADGNAIRAQDDEK